MAAVSAKRYNILERLVRLNLTGFRFKKLNFKSWLKNISFIRSAKKVWKHIFTFLKNLNFRCNSQLTFHRNLAWLYWSISIRDLFFYSEEIVFDVAYFFVWLCLFVFWRCNWEKFFLGKYFRCVIDGMRREKFDFLRIFAININFPCILPARWVSAMKADSTHAHSISHFSTDQKRTWGRLLAALPTLTNETVYFYSS